MRRSGVSFTENLGLARLPATSTQWIEKEVRNFNELEQVGIEDIWVNDGGKLRYKKL
jgi:hypothetical protein